MSDLLLIQGFTVSGKSIYMPVEGLSPSVAGGLGFPSSHEGSPLPLWDL